MARGVHRWNFNSIDKQLKWLWVARLHFTYSRNNNGNSFISVLDREKERSRRQIEWYEISLHRKNNGILDYFLNVFLGLSVCLSVGFCYLNGANFYFERRLLTNPMHPTSRGCEFPLYLPFAMIQIAQHIHLNVRRRMINNLYGYKLFASFFRSLVLHVSTTDAFRRRFLMNNWYAWIFVFRLVKVRWLTSRMHWLFFFERHIVCLHYKQQL